MRHAPLRGRDPHWVSDRSLLLLWPLLLLAVALPPGCGGDAKKKGKVVKTAKPAVKAIKNASGGLVFRLSEGEGQVAQGKGRRATKGKALTAEQTATLTARLPALVGLASDKQAFALRERSLPAPRTGKTIKSSFPPPPAPPAPAASKPGPLRVLRVAPKDEVRLAPNLSVTFSQPMVAVTSHADSIAQGVPVKIEPQVKGTWRWIGTKTLLFEPKPRFPMATRFTAWVPAGSPSALGSKLAADKKWSFTTPTPQLTSYWPTGGSHRRDVKLFVAFNQRIDADKVLATIKLEAGGKAYKLTRLDEKAWAPDKDLKKDKTLAQYEVLRGLVKGARKGRFVAFAPAERLPADTSFTVRVGPGTPSAEGPLKTEKEQTFSFRTYAPLKVTYHSCDRYKCSPLSPLRISFNNRLDASHFDDKALAKLVKVTPKLPGQRVVVSYRSLTVYGRTRGRTTYRVSLPSDITDVYGQKLGGPNIIPFRFGSASPRLSSNGPAFRVLDPSGEKKFVINSINHKELDLELYRVDPTDWPAFHQWRYRGMRKETPEPPPGKLAYKTILRPGGEPDEMVDTKIDLSKALQKGAGQVLVLVKQRPLAVKPWSRQYVTAWVQVTDFAVDAFVDHSQLLAWVTRLADGKPVSGAAVSLAPDGARGTSDKLGLARLELSSKSAPMLVARVEGQTVMLPRSTWSATYGWHRGTPPRENVRWYVFDDRKLYRPKETVHLKGWARLVHMGKDAGIRLLPAEAKEVRYQVYGPRGNKVGEGSAPLGKLGGFSFDFKLPDAVNLGSARVHLSISGVSAPGSSTSHHFRIEEFRRPEFEVAASATAGPHFIGGHGQFTATASYFSGGPLPNAEVAWRVSTAAGSFTPPNQSAYTFVGWSPGWWRKNGIFKSSSQRYEARSDGRGRHRLRVDFDSVQPPRPVVVRATATVKDVNRQTWTSSTQLLVHPAAVYVGLKTKRYFVERGKPLDVDMIVSDLDGKLVKGIPIALSAVRIAYGYKRGRWERREVDAQNCNEVSSDKPVTCKLSTQKGGTYLLRAEVKDKDGRPSRTEMTRWVSGGKQPREKNIKQETARLIADKKTYAPGDTAEILVQAPFEGAEGLFTVLRGGILSEERFRIDGSSHTLKVKIDERAMPSLSVRVDLVGKAPRLDADGNPLSKLPPRPAYAVGALSLSVPPLSRKLQVQVEPAHKRASPGLATQIGVTVRDAKGQPVAGAGVAVLVVDESVLALTGYKLADPIGTFYPYRYGGLSTAHLRAYVRLADPVALLERASAGNKQSKLADSVAARPAPAPPTATAAEAPTGGAMPKKPGAPRMRRAAKKAKGGYAREEGKMGLRGLAGNGSRTGKKAPKIAMRKNFAALALFAPALTTDASGKVSVPFKLPDNLTRYRVMAVAVADARFYGKGEDTITARLPLMVRPSPPRFLNFGDQAELPVVLHNQTSASQTVHVALRATNVEILGAAGREVTIAADDRIEVRFPVKAVSAGIARFQLGVSAGSFSDAAQFKLPVWTPATTEAFATYGTIDKGAIVQPVKMPTGVVKQFGGLEITTSSTALSALTDAVLYLVAYPYECSEQLSSRVLAVASLKDVLSAFKAKGLPPAATIVKAVERDLKRLQGMQNYEGGFPIWVRGKPSWPFMSVHVTHALERAKAKGFSVPPDMLNRARNYLRRVENYIPSEYGIWTRRIIVAYSLYVRQLAGDRDVAKAKSLLPHFIDAKQPYFEGIGWLYPVLSGAPEAKAEIAKIRGLLNNRVTETAAAAHFATSYTDGAHLILHSDRRVDGLLLEGLIKDQPRSKLIVKIVRGLLAHRKRGRWGNTQENAWVLLAMDTYFNKYEKLTPNFVARAWLGPRFAGEHTYRGRTTEKHEIAIPMRYLAEAKAADLTLAKQGAGRLYYRIGMRYAPADLKPPPASHGFTVRRRYEAVDDPKDVSRDKDGTWRVKAGKRVRVVLTLVAPTRRYHVALVDPLPAGLEPLNPALRGTERHMPKVGGPSRYGRGRGRGWGRFPSHRRPSWGYRGWWRRDWFEHQNLRDERAEAFTSLLWGGVHSYKYIARATTPGIFVVPPPKAEEMYHPETFGRGPGDKLIVE